ncbi:MAG: hypothetical protein ACOZQL_38770 [Myxococcota bacterium]
MSNQTDSRWNSWMGRARTCFRAATAIDASATAVTSTVREFEGANDELAGELVASLREAEAALARARDAVQAALAARKLTPQNREPVYGLAS